MKEIISFENAKAIRIGTMFHEAVSFYLKGNSIEDSISKIKEKYDMSADTEIDFYFRLKDFKKCIS